MDNIRKFMSHFKLKTKDLALYYLELSENDLQEAIKMLEKDCSYRKKEKPSFKVLEWNIQGLLPDCLKERTESIIKEINLLKPDAVFLQEMVNFSFNMMKEGCKEYNFHVQECTIDYYVVILTRKSSLSVQKQEIISFANSKQGRQLIKVEAIKEDQPIVLMTSHLESLRTGSEERLSQLKKVFQEMNCCSSDCLVIFGADTNLRDYEYKSFCGQNKILKSNIVDAWEDIGRPIDSAFTWDLTQNDNQVKNGKARLRFERVYIRTISDSLECKYRPRKISLIGKSRVAGGYFPSDHWGLVVSVKSI